MRQNPTIRSLVSLVLCVTAGFTTGLGVTTFVPVGVRLEAFPRQAEEKQAAPKARVFASDAGVVLNFVKPDKTADFEAVIAKLKEALQKSEKPERKQQALSWKVFRANEPGGNGSVLYLFTIDPAVKGADYTVSTILAEAFPSDVQTLYKQYSESYAMGQNFVNLSLVASLGSEQIQ